MEYIDGIKTENPFVNQLENKINEIKQDEREGGLYMQYDLHLRQIEKEAKKEGMIEAIVNNIKSLMTNLNMTAENAIKILNIPQEEQDFYLAKLNPAN